MNHKNNKPKFTPGPWRVDPNYPSDVLAENRAVVIQNDAINIDSPETQANAALIASAPEMYSVLEDIIKADVTGGHDELHYKIKNALVKARGES